MPELREICVANNPAGIDTPLPFALPHHDQSTLQMVADAIEKKQVMLAYQPIVRAQNQTNVAFYEGLIRVLDSTGTIIPASRFMNTIENTDLGRQLDVLALAQGLRVLHEKPDLRLSINMSARSIGSRQWNRTLDRWLARNTLIAERLILEITESSAMTAPDLVADFMRQRQLQGVSFALDDFGAGCTALSYFKDFSFDVLKIDGQFIQGIANDPDNQALTAALVSIAKHFDMLTVAEFVETREDANILTRMGIDSLQGHYFAAATTRPAWLAQRTVQRVS